MNRKLIFFALLFFSVKIVLADENLKSIDVMEFDIAGVKLGMTQKQTIKVLAKTLNIDKSAIELSAAVKNPITKKEQFNYLIARLDGEEYRIHFTPNLVDGNGKELIAYRIIYDVNNNEERNILSKSILKYGKPSKDLYDKQGSIYMSLWCKDPTKDPDYGCDVFQGDAFLLYYQNSLILYDYQLTQGTIKHSKSEKAAGMLYYFLESLK